MTLSRTTIDELNSIKGKIERLENLMASMQTELEIAYDLDDKSKIKDLESKIELADNKIKHTIDIQAKVMRLDPVLVLDLVFDREETLKRLQ